MFSSVNKLYSQIVLAQKLVFRPTLMVTFVTDLAGIIEWISSTNRTQFTYMRKTRISSHPNGYFCDCYLAGIIEWISSTNKTQLICAKTHISSHPIMVAFVTDLAGIIEWISSTNKTRLICEKLIFRPTLMVAFVTDLAGIIEWISSVNLPDGPCLQHPGDLRKRGLHIWKRRYI